MSNDCSINELIKANKLSIDDKWQISFAILDWLEKKLSSQKIPYLFYTEQFQFNINEKKIIYPDENIVLIKSDFPFEYLSPEETGRIDSVPNFRANFYRLGIIWFEIFCGKPPFNNDDPLKIIWQHLADSPPPIKVGTLPQTAITIIEKLLSKKTDERYNSLEGLKIDWNISYQNFLNPATFQVNFVPGSFDFEESFVLPKDLSKKVVELNQIEQIYEGISQKGGKGIVFISGQPLIGKTTFIRKLSSHFLSKGFVIFQSKCLQIESFPFEPIKEAFNQYANDLLLTASKRQLNKLKENLTNSLGENISVLISFSSIWEQIISEKAGMLKSIGFESLNRLAFVLSKTLSIISNTEYPILFVLDDFHFISPQTLRLYNAIIEEPELDKCLMIVSSSEGVTPREIHDSTFAIIPTEKFKIIEKIELLPLTKEEIINLLEKERIDREIAHEFSILIHRKTLGIPIFIDQLVQKVTECGFIKLGQEKKVWLVDIKGVASLSITDESFESQINKLNYLDNESREWIEAAACDGIQFDLFTIKAVLNNIEEDKFNQITKYFQFNEIIVPDIFDTNKYRFSHPSLYKYLIDTIDKSKRHDIIKAILNIRLNDTNFIDNDNNLYKLIGFIIELPNEDKWKYGNLLEEGSERAKKIGAFENAVKYYSALIDSQKTATEKEQFEWHSQLLEMLIGDLQFDAYNRKLNEIHASFLITEVMQIRLDLIECKSLILQQKMPEAVTHARLSLKRVGINIDLNPGLPKIIFSMIRAQRSMRGRSINELENLPLAKDRKTKYILEILQETSSAFFLAAPKALPEVLALQINMALKEGISESMGMVFATYGFNISAFAGEFNKSEEMMLLARNLDLRFGNIKGAVVDRFLHAGLTRHWHFSIKENATLLRENYQFAKESGLTQMAYFSLATGDLFEIFSGKPIKRIFPQLEADYKSCIDKQQNSMATFIRMALEFCGELSGSKKPASIMEGEYFSVEVEKKIFIESNLQTNLAIINCFESLLNLIWGNNKVARERLIEMNALLAEVGLSSLSLILAIMQTTISAYKETGNPNSRMRANRKKIRSWAKQSGVNFMGWHQLLEAVICIRNNKYQQAFYHLEYCIEWAEKQDMLLIKALALEEKGNLIHTMNAGDKIPLALVQAYKNYQSWGANAKCAELEKLHKNIRQLSIQEKNFDSNLDITSLLRATNSIASEIKWENLLETLMTILIENAGAQEAVIIIPEENWYKEVARKSGNNEVIFKSQIINENTLPISMIQAVQRSQKAIITNNPSQNPRWSIDQYFIKQNPLSSLCIPILKNLEIRAIIYMENNLTSGAFTQERVELITLLSGQIAISIVIEKLESEILNEVNKAKHEIQQFTLNNISQELHDNVGQVLSLTKMQLNRLVEMDKNDMEIIKEASQNVSKVMSELRNLAKGMSGERISLIGLYESVLEEVDRINKSGIIKVNLSYSGTKREPESRKQLVIFRVIQESFQNIIKHAKADSVEVIFVFEPNQIKITIKDDGKGFDFDLTQSSNSGLGLMNIFNRIKMVGGDINLQTSPGKGTEIEISIAEY
jgi:signal transduction histidine kinase/predicted ATPase